MKKLFKMLTSGFLAMTLMVSVTACDLFGKDDTIYTISYSDSEGVHNIEVAAGNTYSLESIPQKTGYEFIGLFDSAVGGTQYVSELGTSLSPYKEKKNLVLYPQYKAKLYNLMLDYQGAGVTGDRKLTVEYNSEIPQLPINLYLEHKEFIGWFTQKDCGGTQVADTYGIIPDKAILNEKNFSLPKADEYVYLYAGFEAQKYTVTFNFGDGYAAEEMQVAYGTPLSEILPETRNEDGEAVYAWRKSETGSDIFTGKITESMDLYAAEWAPVITFESNGGKELKPIIAREGASIALPKAEKELSRFMGWVTSTGEAVTWNQMPAKSVTLKATWQGKLEFDENGGSEVNDISVKAGEQITLPTPEREGFIFAGWFNAEKEQFTATKMPKEGVALKAGWYQAKKRNKIFLEAGDESSLFYTKTPVFKTNYRIDLTEEISDMEWSHLVNVKLTFYADIKHESTNKNYAPTYATKEHFYYYSQELTSDVYLMGKNIIDHGKGLVNESYTSVKFSTKLMVDNGKIFIALGSDKDRYDKDITGRVYNQVGWRMTNFWVEIEYPDTLIMY